MAAIKKKYFSRSFVELGKSDFILILFDAKMYQ
jgi:hypothetical protein